MSKKTLIILVMLFIILAGLILAYFFIFKSSKDIIDKERFSVKLPEGWTETDSVPGAAATAMNNQEQITDPGAQKINFQTYYSVVYDTFNEKTEKDYLEKIKDSLKQGFSEIQIFDAEKKSINGKDIYFIESELKQSGVEFKVLLAVNIIDKEVWIISFNTLKSNWDKYKDLFYQIAESFKIK